MPTKTTPAGAPGSSRSERVATGKQGRGENPAAEGENKSREVEGPATSPDTGFYIEVGPDKPREQGWLTNDQAERRAKSKSSKDDD